MKRTQIVSRALLISAAALSLLTGRTVSAQDDELADGGRATWETIQQDILNINCVGCHTAGSSFARQSGLILTSIHTPCRPRRENQERST